MDHESGRQRLIDQGVSEYQGFKKAGVGYDVKKEDQRKSFDSRTGSYVSVPNTMASQSILKRKKIARRKSSPSFEV